MEQAFDIDRYVAEHTSPEPQHLRELWRYTNLHCLYPRMCSGHVQGRLLKMLTTMIAPRMAVEIGTFTGYSALCIAEGMADEARLYTIEIDDEKETALRSLFASRPEGRRIELCIGDALEILPALEQQWDMAFIDANKRHYNDYLDLLLPHMRPGGYILADNTLWDGHPGSSDDAQTRGIMEFNDRVCCDPALETVMVPVRDGLTLIRVADPQAARRQP